MSLNVAVYKQNAKNNTINKTQKNTPPQRKRKSYKKTQTKEGKKKQTKTKINKKAPLNKKLRNHENLHFAKF